MDDQFITPEQMSQAPAPDGRRRMLIIGGVALVLLCCCCTLVVAAWYGGDYVMQFFNSAGF